MKPTKPGMYFVKCDESGGDWTPIEVYKEDGFLKVDCPDIGRGYGLDHYHNNLTCVEWKPWDDSMEGKP